MAAVRTVHSMTLGNQTTKMYTMIQQHLPAQNNNCVIVPGGQTLHAKSVIHQPHATAPGGVGKRPLAPAPERSSVVVNNSANIANNAAAVAGDMLRCKRKINFAHHMPYGGPGHQPASVARRNARERNRVKQVNNGFATLRQHIPASVASALASSGGGPSTATTAAGAAGGGGRGASKKLSKVETLRMAVEYIRSLQQMIEDHEAETSSTTTGSESHLLENQYYASSPESAGNMHQHLGHTVLLQQTTPPCSESSASPTPSYSSEGSISTPTAYTPIAAYQPDSYENYEPMSPEDEELLDVISWWQQQ